MNAENLNWHDVTMGLNEQRLRRAQSTLTNLSAEEQVMARLEECADEKTGRRYGQVAKRRGKCVKIGGGGRNRGDVYAYQIWLCWD